jgi:hypothetical protein
MNKSRSAQTQLGRIYKYCALICSFFPSSFIGCCPDGPLVNLGNSPHKSRTMEDLLKPFATRVHYYESPTPFSTAYEVGPYDAPNALVAIGGLGDGPHTVPAMRRVAARIDGTHGGPAYSMFEIRMRSSFIGFGTSSLAEDVMHISCLVKYLRGLGKKRIVLMGHSTGCQVGWRPQ